MGQADDRRRRTRGTSESVGANGLLYPGDVFADLRVDSWMLSRATRVNAPGKDALQGLVTDQRATRVTLGVAERREQMNTHTQGLPLGGLGW